MNYTAAYNHHIMNKMLWMSRNLRNFNDTVSISNWAHTMTILKNLLLPPLPPPAPQNIPPPTTQVHNPELVRSITPPHTICFQPAMKKTLTQSAPRCTINKHSKPSPLTTYTHCLPNIPSTDSLSQRPKRRKLSIPPSVDYSASTVTPPPISTATAPSPTGTTPGLGSHIWSKIGLNKEIWSRVKAYGATEYKVVRTPLDFGSEYKLLNTTTGKYYYTRISEEDADFLFKT